jgi:stage II sporulation protein D (peptidoglycan lytic transglycosylase)
LRWICASFLCLSLALHAQAQPRTVRIGVLGIFHPQQLTLAADQTDGLLIAAAQQQLFLQLRSKCPLLRIRASGDTLLLTCGAKEFKAGAMRATSRNQQSASFYLTVPGRLKRRYEGILDLKANHGELIPIITMDLETAVASVVQAESAPGAPLETLQAQAVVSRSYFVAGVGRHADFDFCDLTHCQFLREPPSPDAPAALASAATRGMVLTYNAKPIAAMFTRSCAGHTRTPPDIALPARDYPYFSVLCDFCYQNPFRWTREVSPQDAALLFQRGEAGRLDIGRRLGWNAVPSDNFTATEQNGTVILHGTGQGHGVGLCQRGARDMAERGADFRQILHHYFPNTKLQDLSATGGGVSNSQ